MMVDLLATDISLPWSENHVTKKIRVEIMGFPGFTSGLATIRSIRSFDPTT